MNPRIAAYLLGGAACLFMTGCDDDDDTYAYTHTRGGYYASEPVFVERRSVVIDDTPRYVPIYRTGRSYYYTYNGRRFDYDYDGGVSTRTRVVSPAYSRTYRSADVDYDTDRRVVRRTVTRDNDDDRVTYRSRHVTRDTDPVVRTRVRTDGAAVTVRDTDDARIRVGY